jgi:ribosomal protein L11 methyltransferase
MSWWTIEVDVAGARSEDVATALVQLTGQAVEERATAVVGFAADERAAKAAAESLQSLFPGRLATRITAVADVDWSTRWRDGLAVREVGPLSLGPSWLLEPGPDHVVIDPETAFGSGEHGSTRGALRLLCEWLEPGQVVLDLGSGSGILAFGAVKLGARGALGIEVDAEAVPIAEANAAINQVADRVRFLVGDARALAPLAGPVDVVVSNILRTANETLLDPIRRSLAPGGIAIFAGMEEPEAPLFLSALTAAGFDPMDDVVDEGWWSVAARRLEAGP